MTSNSQILKVLEGMAESITTAPRMLSPASSINVPNFRNAFLPSSVHSASSIPPNQAVKVPGAANGGIPFAGMMSSNPNFAEGVQRLE